VLQYEFFSQMVDSLVADEVYLPNICFSYEATSHLRRMVNIDQMLEYGEVTITIPPLNILRVA